MEGILGIRYKTRELLLDGGTRVDWRLEDDVLNYDHIGQGHSWTVDMPYEGNAKILDFAGSPVSANGYQTYDEFFITFGGNIWWEVVFTHTETTTETISGTFSTVSSAFYDHKDVSIREILAGVRWRHPLVADVSGETYIEAYFPEFNFYGSSVLYNTFTPFFEGSDLRFRMDRVPCFKLMEVLQMCIRQIGMELDDNLTVIGGDLHKLMLLHNRYKREVYDEFQGSLTASLDASEEVYAENYLTDITLMELLEILVSMTGGSLAISKDIRVLEVNGLSRVNNRQPVDLRGRVNRLWETGRPDRQSVQVAYDLSDELLKNVTKPNGDDIGVYDTVTTFAAAANPGEHGFVTRENAYYECANDGGTEVTRRVGMDCLPYEYKDDEAAREVVVKACPAEKHRYVFRRFRGVFEIDDTDANIIISGFDDPPSIQVGDYLLMVEDNDEQLTYTEVYREITEVYTGTNPTKANYYVKLGNDPLQGTPKVGEVVVRSEINRYMPVVGADAYNPFYPKVKRKEIDVPRILLYHGIQNDLDGGTYEMASCDNLDSAGNTIGDYTLNTTQPGGLIKTYYDKFGAWLSNTMTVRLYAYLTHQEVADIAQQKVMLTEDGLIRLKQLEMEASEQGSREMMIEGYRV